MRLELGTKVGEWELVSEIDPGLVAPLFVGDNGTLIVYVRAYRVRSMKVAERVEQLAKWAASFEHNCILPVREVHEVVGGTAIVSNYEEGQPLSAVLARARLARKPVPPSVAAAIAIDLLDGLNAMGGRLAPAWAHGGVRPESVLITRGGRARIMEVGISGEMASVEPLASDKKWAAYAAPEQAEGGRLTEQSDIFTVASITWEMLVGKPLFESRNPAALKQMIIDCKIERADVAARTKVPTTMALILEQALDADPADRFETTTAFSRALQSAADDVAEQIEVSKYLEQVQRVALDTRRRSLNQALGRSAPVSMPPPAAKRAGASVPKFAAPPRIPNFAITPKPTPAKKTPLGQPRGAQASNGIAARRRAEAEKRSAEAPTETSNAAAAESAPPPPDGRDEDQRLSTPLELLTPKPDDSAPSLDWSAPKSEPAPQSAPESQSAPAPESAPAPASEPAADDDPSPDSVPASDAKDLAADARSSDASDVAFSDSPDDTDDSPVSAPPSSMGEEIIVDESTAGGSPYEDEDAGWDAESPVSEPAPSLSVDIAVDESLAGEDAPPDDNEATSAPPAAPAPSASPVASVSAAGPPVDPFADLQLDDGDLYNLKPPRRWPWFVLGVVVGAAVALGVAYQAPHLLPAPLPGTGPTPSAPLTSTTETEVQPPPRRDDFDDVDDVESDEDAEEEAAEKPADEPPPARPRRPRPRRRTRQAAQPAAKAPAAPPPAAQPPAAQPPAAPPPPPAAPPPAPGPADDAYE